MAKISDRHRILRLLSESEGMSNLKVKTELNLTDGRYGTVRDGLLADGLVEKYVCQGGGIRITRKGERESPDYDESGSGVDRERDLYLPLVKFLRDQSEEDEAHAVIFATDTLKSRGQWQNPDITKIEVEYYSYLRKTRVTVTTYEVKQFPKWTVGAVYEAASHHRFAHETFVVLEWPAGVEFSLTDATYRVAQIARECQRFGVGLATLSPHYRSYRLLIQIDPRPVAPLDEHVESWLQYSLGRHEAAEREFNALAEAVQGRGWNEVKK